MERYFRWLLLALCPALAAEPTAHLRGADGIWHDLEARQEGTCIVVTVSPSASPNGRALLVINKPDWMDLGDNAAPRLVQVQLGQQLVACDGGLGLTASQDQATTLTFTFTDDRSPLDPFGCRLSLRGLPEPVRGEALSAGPPGRTEEFRLTLPPLPPGAYSGRLEAADLSPTGNVFSLPCTVTVLGAQLAADLGSLRLVAPGAVYTLKARPRLMLSLGDAGPDAYLTAQVADEWLFPRRITEAVPLVADPNRCVWRVTADAGDADGKPVATPAHFELDLELRGDLPCLIVRSRAFNDVADGELYNFWGWLPGDGYETPEGHKPWSMTYREVGQTGWVFLPPADAAQPGVGWISSLPFGESRFGSMLLYTQPRRVPVRQGESVEMSFAIMPASSAQQVAAVAQRLQELGCLP